MKQDRPYVVCHMVTTIDGKILTDRWKHLPAGKSGSKLFESTAEKIGIDAWLVGTTTMIEFADGKFTSRKSGGRVPPGDFIAQVGAKSFGIGTDAKGTLRFKSNDIDGDHAVLLITEQASAAYRAHLREAGVSYFVCGARELNLAQALKKLQRAFGLKKLCLQGGGTFNGAMLAAGLIDEMSQVIIPVVDGGGPEVTGFLDTPGKPPRSAAAQLRLMHEQTLGGGAHWFRYRLMRT